MKVTASFAIAWMVRSIRVATDVLPLLVSACSTSCLSTLPRDAQDSRG